MLKIVKPLVFEKPLGVRDYLPDQVRWKKEVERRISESMELWGYREIITPALEYYDTVGDSSNIMQNRLYKLVDHNGKTLVLRPDMTTPIARVVSSLLKENPLPMRLCYNTSIYRMQEKDTGKNAEFFQSGVELIGSDQPYADAEIIVLAVEALKAAGLRQFKVAIGETAFLESLLHEKASRYSDQLKKLLIKQDFAGWREFVNGLPLAEQDKACLLTLPKLQGSKEVISQAETLTDDPKAIKALRYLQEIWDILEQHQVSQYVHIDFTTLRGQNYYTGMIFEIYAASIGYPICGGGRYDDLIAEFGRKAPAVGFGIWLERLIEALQVGILTPEIYLFLFDQEDQTEVHDVIKRAKIWREKGNKVEILGCPADQLERIAAERKNDCQYLQIWTSEQWKKHVSCAEETGEV